MGKKYDGKPKVAEVQIVQRPCDADDLAQGEKCSPIFSGGDGKKDDVIDAEFEVKK